jgi:hypothetical protein
MIGHLLRDQLVVLFLLRADDGGEVEIQRQRDRNRCKRGGAEPDFS